MKQLSLIPLLLTVVAWAEPQNPNQYYFPEIGYQSQSSGWGSQPPSQTQGSEQSGAHPQYPGHCPTCGNCPNSGDTCSFSAGPNVPKQKEITPIAGPRVRNGVGAFLTADFIYWTAREDGLGYALSGQRNTVANVEPSQGSLKEPDFKFDPGFKVGLGLSFEHDGWDLYAQYTWLYTSKMTDTTTQSDPATTTLIPLWNIAGGFLVNGDKITRGSARWELKFNVVDLELGRNFYISRYLKLRPHLGLKGTWQDQDYRVTYREENVALNRVDYRMDQDNDFWGIGFRGGLNSSWQFNDFIGLVGHLVLSSLWGKFDVDRKDRSQIVLNGGVPTGDPEVVELSVQHDFHSFRPILEYLLGLRMETWFGKDQYHFALLAGWEGQVWWSQNELITTRLESNHEGHLVLQGLTVRFRLDF